MSRSAAFLMILVIAAVTALIRFLPFFVFSKRKTPAFILYLGKVLPPAVMGMLVVYCLKNVSFHSAANWLPACISAAAVILLHARKRNTLLSISLGTILYMVLIRVII